MYPARLTTETTRHCGHPLLQWLVVKASRLRCILKLGENPLSIPLDDASAGFEAPRILSNQRWRSLLPSHKESCSSKCFTMGDPEAPLIMALSAASLSRKRMMSVCCNLPHKSRTPLTAARVSNSYINPSYPRCSRKTLTLR